MEGRWAVRSEHDGRQWDVIVEPDERLEADRVGLPRTPLRIDMKETYLEVTFRHGQPFAAYY